MQGGSHHVGLETSMVAGPNNAAEWAFYLRIACSAAVDLTCFQALLLLLLLESRDGSLAPAGKVGTKFIVRVRLLPVPRYFSPSVR